MTATVNITNPPPLWIKRRADLTMQWFNEEYSRRTGYSRKDFYGQQDSVVMDKETAELVRAFDLAVIEAGQPMMFSAGFMGVRVVVVKWLIDTSECACVAGMFINEDQLCPSATLDDVMAYALQSISTVLSSAELALEESLESLSDAAAMVRSTGEDIRGLRALLDCDCALSSSSETEHTKQLSHAMVQAQPGTL